eukprot:TRINITY_DN28448_c0_g1_i1.p3 TRINITY_DN28448_c0_g1~~TRINITY_DN28448_c0_g1_i1.p3  ORF type:complete len:101 (+),score=27.19 TRINITY_DN28448_c0_g1_i1:61-363(+)
MCLVLGLSFLGFFVVCVLFFFFFSSRRRHTRCREVSWARRCVQETGYYVCLLRVLSALVRSHPLVVYSLFIFLASFLVRQSGLAVPVLVLINRGFILLSL